MLTMRIICRANSLEGYHVCEYKAAAAAGAVYGALTFWVRLPFIWARDQIIVGITESD